MVSIADNAQHRNEPSERATQEGSCELRDLPAAVASAARIEGRQSACEERVNALASKISRQSEDIRRFQDQLRQLAGAVAVSIRKLDAQFAEIRQALTDSDERVEQIVEARLERLEKLQDQKERSVAHASDLQSSRAEPSDNHDGTSWEQRMQKILEAVEATQDQKVGALWDALETLRQRLEDKIQSETNFSKPDSSIAEVPEELTGPEGEQVHSETGDGEESNPLAIEETRGDGASVASGTDSPALENTNSAESVEDNCLANSRRAAQKAYVEQIGGAPLNSFRGRPQRSHSETDKKPFFTGRKNVLAVAVPLILVTITCGALLFGDFPRPPGVLADVLTGRGGDVLFTAPSVSESDATAVAPTSQARGSAGGDQAASQLGAVSSDDALRDPVTIERLTAAAEAGSAAAALLLGIEYLNGNNVAESGSQAFRWLLMAAERGNVVAQERVGMLLEYGIGVPVDAREAALWYAKAAERGNMRAMHSLGVLYSEGTGIELDFSEAARLFRAAAELGLPESQYNLAVLYATGLGLPRSLGDSYEWYLIASSHGDTEAQERANEIKSVLPSEMAEAAERNAASFTPRGFDESANVVPVLSDALE